MVLVGEDDGRAWRGAACRCERDAPGSGSIKVEELVGVETDIG